QRGAVGDGYGRGPRRPARGHDASGCRLLGFGKPFDAVHRDERIDGHHEPTVTAELLGYGRSDPAGPAGDDDHGLTGAHGRADRLSTSSPSNSAAASQPSSRSR